MIKTIIQENKQEIIISKSRFIACVFNVKTKTQVDALIKAMNQKYYDATHVCYAYVLGINAEIQKTNDDNEPKGTAGLPILNIIQQNALSNIIVFVVRYFGGVKLGAGGLIRAYSNSAKSVIEISNKEILQKYYYYELTFEISETKLINDFLFQNQINHFLKQEYFDNGQCLYLFKSSQEIVMNKKIKLKLIDFNY